MKNATTQKTIIPKIFKDNRFIYIAEKVWNGSEWIKIDYYNMVAILEQLSTTVSFSDDTKFKIMLDNSLIA